MPDNDDAQYYQAHKDDEDEWGEPESGPGRPRRRLASMISVRFSPAEARVIRAEAERRGQSVSQFIRHAALSECGVVTPATSVFISAPRSVRYVGTRGFWSGTVFQNRPAENETLVDVSDIQVPA